MDARSRRTYQALKTTSLTSVPKQLTSPKHTKDSLGQFGAMDPKVLDPLAPPMPPPPGADGAGGGEADQAPADPAPEPTEEAKADVPEAAPAEAEE